MKPTPSHITVTGIRGKSSTVRHLERVLYGRGYQTLAKVTGDAPFWVHNGTVIPIHRKPYTPVDLHETLEYRRFKYDVLIAENQGIHPHTMRAFNEIVRPQVTLITNVRLDHTDAMGPTRKAIAASLGRGIGRWPQAVISTEPNQELNEIIRREIPSSTALRRLFEHGKNPMSYFHPLVNGALSVIGEPGLSESESNDIDLAINDAMQIKSAPLSWYDGAKVNDLDSAYESWGWLAQQCPKQRWDIVAYFRHDRIERTVFFLPWLQDMAAHQQVRKIHLVGFGAEEAARRIGNGVTVWPDSARSIDSICRQVTQAETAIYLSCNAVNNFMRRFRERLGQPSQKAVA